MQVIIQPALLLRRHVFVTLVSVLSLLLFVAAQPAMAGDKLRFAVYYPHFPPYVYSTPDEKIVGIIPELLAEFFLKQDIEPEYIFDNRSGAEHRLYKGEVDAMMLGPQWAKHPEQLVFSQPILPYYDYLFSQQEDDSKLQTTQLTGFRVCTREHYIYPALEPLFASQTLIRTDASSQEAQLRMLQNDRCDLVYLNSLAAAWAIKQKLSPPLYKLPVLTQAADFTVALHPRWHGLLPALNAYLLQQQKEGRIQQLVSKHTD